MTNQSSAAVQLTLDPATTDETLATIFGAQRVNPEHTPAQQQTQREAAVALIAALRPRDPVEAAYAARAAAAHYGAMECFRRATLSDMPVNAVLRWYGKALALSRMNTDMIRTLEQSQAANPHVQAQVAARPATSPSPAMAEAARREAAIAAKPVGTQACPRALDPRDPMSSERPAPAPAAFPVKAGSAAKSFLAAPPPHQGARAALLGSVGRVGATQAALAA